MDPSTGIDTHRHALAAAVDALTSMGSMLHSVDNSQLGELLSEVDALVAAGAGTRAEVVLETVRRGVHLELGKDIRGWIITYCPSLRQAGAGQLAKIVTETTQRTPITAGCDYNNPDSPVDPHTPIARIWAHVRTGQAAAPMALAVLAEMDKLTGRIQPDFIPTVTDGMLTVGIGLGPTAMRELKMKLIAKHALPDEVANIQQPLTRHAYLTSPQPESGDLTRYSMGLTPEQAAVLEAVLGPLSKPQPNPETNERDLRPAGQRRAEALIDLASHIASHDADHKGGPASADTTVFLTINLTDLQSESGAGEVIASRADGTVLSAATIRAMCCDTDLIPLLLGSKGEVLHHGQTQRLFTRAQRTALWHRDRGCTYPGCAAPATWTKAHHIQHWADNGPTDLTNAALLCQRHHSHVHSNRLWAEVHSTPDDHGRHVHWNTTKGSYDHALKTRGRPPRRLEQPERREPLPDGEQVELLEHLEQLGHLEHESSA